MMSDSTRDCFRHFVFNQVDETAQDRCEISTYSMCSIRLCIYNKDPLELSLKQNHFSMGLCPLAKLLSPNTKRIC